MATFLELQRRAERLTPQKIRSDLFKFIRTLENELALYNRSQLFVDSFDVHGKPIGFYSKATEEITEGRKKEGQPFNLFETGKFLPSIFAKLQKDSVFFGAKDPKLFDVLENLLSKDIFGLTSENLVKVIDERMLPFFQQYFRKHLLG